MFRNLTFLSVLLLIVMAFPGQTAAAENAGGKGLSESTVAANVDPLKAAPVAVKPASKPAAGLSEKISRWFDLQSAAIETRYRFIDNSKGVTTNNQFQDKEGFKGRLKLDPKGNYSINAGVFSGNSFTGSWNTTGWGTGPLVTNLYLKQLYFAAKPFKVLELQYGGLYMNRGESTEAIGYDNDAYLLGERLSLKAPKQLFFDEISVTYGYIGDLNKPNINKRFYRLKSSNYHQFLVGKKLSKRVGVSADYSFLSGVETLREAIKLGTKELKVVDSVLFENYQRTDVKPDYGYNLFGDKALHKRLTVGGGFASIDPNYGGLNGDRFNKGKRVYTTSSFVLTPELTVSTFLTRAVANDFAVTNRTRFDLILSYNVLKSLQRAGLFKAPSAK